MSAIANLESMSGLVAFVAVKVMTRHGVDDARSRPRRIRRPLTRGFLYDEQLFGYTLGKADDDADGVI